MYHWQHNTCGNRTRCRWDRSWLHCKTYSLDFPVYYRCDLDAEISKDIEYLCNFYEFVFWSNSKSISGSVITCISQVSWKYVDGAATENLKALRQQGWRWSERTRRRREDGDDNILDVSILCTYQKSPWRCFVLQITLFHRLSRNLSPSCLKHWVPRSPKKTGTEALCMLRENWKRNSCSSKRALAASARVHFQSRFRCRRILASHSWVEVNTCIECTCAWHKLLLWNTVLLCCLVLENVFSSARIGEFNEIRNLRDWKFSMERSID
jgi:hypothetical protein